MSDLDLLRYRTRPAAGKPEGLLVLLHGRGADEHDLFPLLDALDPERRRLGVTARAPLALPPGGAHWYVVERVGFPHRETFDATRARAGAWLDALAAESGIGPERTVLGGFSQGAVMTYALGLGEGRPRPQALAAFSGFVPQVEGFALDLAPPLPPVAIAHGTYDDVIPIQFGRQARDLLTAAGAEVLWRESPLPHAIDPHVLAEVERWLAGLESPAAGMHTEGRGGSG